MMHRIFFAMAILSCLGVAPMSAQDDVKAKLTRLFEEAEQCYLMDDYQQLSNCIYDYYDIWSDCTDELGDSADVYDAYYYKMRGADLYGTLEDQDDVKKVEHFYRMSLDIFNKRNNTTNALVIHEELAQMYYKAKCYEMAKEQLDTVFDYYDERLNGMGITSVKPQYYKVISQLAMCNARLGNFPQALSQIDEAIDDYFKKQKGSDYYEALRKKAKILMLQSDVEGSTDYSKAVECYKRYVNERCASIGEELSGKNDSQRAQYWLAAHQLLFDCFRLGNHAPDLLYDLSLFSKDYLVRKNASLTKWKQVRQALGKKDCAIEFVQYFGIDDEKRLGCLVLRHDSKKPLFIDMFATDSMLYLPVSYYSSIGGAITSMTGTWKDALYEDSTLTKLIWPERLMKAIGDANKVYFASDGPIHQLAIEYIIPDTTKTCYRLSSTRVIAQKRKPVKMGSALLLGGMEFDASYTPSGHDNDVVAYRYMSRRTKTIKSLPGTRKEVDSIYVFRHNPKDTLLVGREATDAAFMKLVKNKYDVIHLSTHGFFGSIIGIHNDIKPLLDDDSMSKSGLLFAGSEKTLTDDDFDESMSDGVLSSEEMSRQDLSGTELVVLSACQTGLGRLTDDGIYGMQRGLKLAGANAMIVSLWNVNDYSSSLLMRFFYQELEKQDVKDIHSAFLAARQRLMKEEMEVYQLDEYSLTLKRLTISFNRPQYINPFIIIDAF